MANEVSEKKLKNNSSKVSLNYDCKKNIEKVILKTKNGDEPFYRHRIKNEKLSIEFCKSILNTDEKNFTDDEVLKIRDFLYQIAEIDFRNYMNQIQVEENKTEPKIIELKKYQDEEKSHSLYPSEYRRAS